MQNIDYLYDSLKDETMQLIGKSYQAPAMKEQFTLWHDAIVLPAKVIHIPERYWVGGCIDASGNLIEDTVVPHLMGWKYEISLPSNNSSIAVYLGYMFNCFGHMLGDCLRWAWFLQTDEYKKIKSQGAKLLYISMAPLKPWQEEMLELAGVEYAERVVEPLKVNQLIIPTPSITTDENEQNYWRPEFKKTIDLMIANAYKSAKRHLKYDKIYLSRTGIGDVLGEKYVEQFYRKHGYKIVHPEQLTVAEQIVMLNNAHDIVATEGSLSHNTIFCKQKTKVHLLRRSLHINRYSLFINDMCKLDAQYIDCSLSLLTQKTTWWDKPFFIYVNKAIADTQNDRCPLFPINVFKNYMKQCLAEKDLAKRLTNIENDYAVILQQEIENLLQRNAVRLNKLIGKIPFFKNKQSGILRRINHWMIRI